MSSKEVNQGEGDRASARRYDSHAQEFVASGKVEPAAEQAKAFVDREPAKAAAAEAEARQGPHSSHVLSIDKLVALGRSKLARLYGRIQQLRDRHAGR